MFELNSRLYCVFSRVFVIAATMAIVLGLATPKAHAISAPAGLSALPASKSQIRLSWNAVSGANSYKVFRNGSPIATTSSTSYTDSGLDEATRYIYSVTSVDASSIESSPSTTSSIMTMGGNIASAFSTTSNPTGLWQYGWASTLGGTFNRYDVYGSSFSGNTGWHSSLITGNIWNVPSTGWSNDAIVMAPYYLNTINYNSVLRYTASTAGAYTLDVTFNGNNGTGATVDVHIYVNKVAVYNGYVNLNGSGSLASYTGSLSLSANDTIDFIVGTGANNEYLSDSTYLYGTITGNTSLPTITGTPPTTIAAGSTYSFTPTATNATSFSCARKPGWANFDSVTGTLSGKPSVAFIGAPATNIMIRATNAAGTTTLIPFDINVTGTFPWTDVMRVKDINPTGSSTPLNMINVNGTFFFVADDGVHGRELWTSDGTLDGTKMVKDINPISGGSNPQSLTNLNGTLYFFADDGSHGSQLWKSDGTEAGTVMVKIINPNGSAMPSGSLSTRVINNVIYFFANDGVHGDELWRSDGTAGGTYLVKDISPGLPGSATYSGFSSVMNGYFYFAAITATNGNELWRSDGTENGTTLVKDIYTGGYSSSPGWFNIVNNILYFIASDVNGPEIWRSDGTEAGTFRVKPGVAVTWPNFLTSVRGNNLLYFIGDDHVYGRELWKSDGTEAGTVLVKDINPGSNGINFPGSLSRLIVGTIIYFAADDGQHGLELWRSDGTSNGTYMVKDINPGSGSSAITNMTSVNGTLFFSADDGTGATLWKSDGTEAGTVKTADTISIQGSGFSNPQNLYSFGNLFFFSAQDTNSDRELWVAPASAIAANATPPNTTVSPVAGSYITSQTVTLTCADASGNDCATTYYCLGSNCTPTTKYTAPIDISSSTSLRFYSVDNNNLNEAIKTFNYIIDPTLGSPPGAPVITSVITGDGVATITFTAPSGSPVTSYTVTSIPSGGVDQNAGSALLTHTIAGLTNGSSYTFTVTATNSFGTSAPSAASEIAIPGSIPRIQLPQTGQTGCWDSIGNPAPCAGTGQDGETQSGVVWFDPRFTNPDGTAPVTTTVINDNLSGLQWVRNAGTPTYGSCSGGPQSWQDALNYVTCLNANSYLGHNDWRLPNTNELASLFNLQQADASIWLNSVGFTNVQSGYYWSSTTDGNQHTYGYNAKTSNNSLGRSPKTNQYLVLPVRTGQFRSVPRTGQTSCWDANGNEISCAGTGQDGDKQAGANWPNPRFTNLDLSTPVSGNTVLDRLTGLEWLKDGSTPTISGCVGGNISWQSALSYVACLNSANYLGHNDWRMPNRSELASLVNWQQPSLLWLNSAGFNGIQAISGNPAHYWTSDTTVQTSNNAWYGSANTGLMGIQSKTASSGFTLLVRGGTIVPARPNITSISTSNGQATISFTAPPANGSAPVTNYIVTAMPGNITTIGASSPITVTGLANGTFYNFLVSGINSSGMGKSAKISALVTNVESVNGRCGSANGGTSTSPPSLNLCSSGTPSAVTGSGPLYWNCAGSGGGATAFCISYLTTNVAAPITTIAPAGGSYSSGSILATLTCSNTAATIYYTTDGSTPTVSSPVYSTPIPVTGNQTIKYFAKDPAGNSEPVRSATYAVTAGGPPAASFTTTKGGTAFTILRSVGGAPPVPVVTDTTSTTFTDTTAILPNTVYQYQVASDTDPTLVVFMTIRTPMYNGWNIIAVPYDTTNVNPASFFGSSVSAIYEWVPTGATPESSTSQLGSYATRSYITPGKGYFVKASNNKTMLVYAGNPGPASATVTLKPGWTMIANPQTTNKTDIGSTWLIDGNPLSDAITANKIGGSIYWWNGTTYDSWTVMGNNPQIEPWKGYWIVNIDNQDHTLTIQ